VPAPTNDLLGNARRGIPGRQILSIELTEQAVQFVMAKKS
jgi:hypothetical protein